MANHNYGILTGIKLLILTKPLGVIGIRTQTSARFDPT